MPAAFWFMVAVLGTAGIAFVTIVIWLSERTKEREAHFRNETLKRIAETGHSDAAIEYLREVGRGEQRQARMKSRLGGLINIATGAALMVFLSQLVPGQAIFWLGLIPLLVGVVLLIFSELMMRSD